MFCPVIFLYAIVLSFCTFRGLITAAVNNHRTKWLISLCGIIGVWVISCDHCYRSLCTSDYHVGISKFLLCRKNHVIPQTSSNKMTLQRNQFNFNYIAKEQTGNFSYLTCNFVTPYSSEKWGRVPKSIYKCMYSQQKQFKGTRKGELRWPIK